MKPLEGIRILTVEHVGAGPYGTMFLAGLGAEVIKIENATTGGDVARHTGPRFLGEDDSEYFQCLNLWKKSVSIDLARDPDKFHALVKDADAVVNNLRGDVPAKLGLDYKSLSSINRRVVCLHISAYGRDNERAAWPGYDFLMQAEAGLMDLTGEPEGAPSRFGTSVIDFSTGMTGAAALLACLLRAKTTGTGCDVDASLFDVALHQLNYMGTWHLNGGEAHSRQPRSAHYSLTPVQTYRTADGWIFVMCMKESFWTALCDALSLKPDSRFSSMAARLENRDALTAALDKVFKGKTTADWLKLLSGRVPVGPVNDMRQALENPFVAATGMVQSIDHPKKRGLRVFTLPVKIDGERPQAVAAEPLEKMKLDGIRVIDLSLFLPGPYLTLALADHGAEVIKVEPPGEGEPTRHLGLSDGPSTVYFRNLNRGKKSVVMDLKQPAEREALLRICETADVFVESFRPGVVDRLGVGYAQVSARNPRIVYCSISAFGQQGPYRDRPAHDLAVEALSGVLSMTLGADGKPAIPGLPLADLLVALQGLAGILMALLRREKTGKGDYLDMAMHDAMFAGLANILGPTFAEGRQPVARHERTTGGSAFYRLYEASDGRHLALGGQEAKFVRNLLGALGRPELAPLCEKPGPHQKPVMDFLEGVFRAKTLKENLAFLAPLDVCYAPVNTLPEALEAAGDKLLTDELGRRHLAPPVRFRDEPARPSLREPKLGEHDALKKGG